MGNKLLRIALLATLTIALLLSGACAIEPPITNTPKIEEEEMDPQTKHEEEEMDPQTKHEVQMIVDAFPKGVEYFEKTVVHSVEMMKKNGMGSFVSVSNVADEEISDFDRKLSVSFMLDIVDDTGECYRVGFSRTGLAVELYLPPYYYKSISLPLPPIHIYSN